MCIIVVQNLDGVCQCHKLFSPIGLNGIPFLLLRCAGFVHIRKELFVLHQRLLGVFKVICHFCIFDSNGSNSLQLCLDRLVQCRDLLSLSSHQLIVILDGSILSVSSHLEICANFVAHLFQDADDLTSLRCVLLSAREEGQHVLPIGRGK